MALQQFQFKTSVFTGTKRANTFGQDLAKLVTKSLNVGSNYMDYKVKEQESIDAENKKIDNTTLNFIKDKSYEYSEKNPNQSYDAYNNYITNEIKNDPDYIEKYGDKNPEDALLTVDGKSALNVWSSRVSKEFGKTPEEIEEIKRKANSTKEAIFFTDTLTNSNNYLTENNYESMSVKEKEVFLKGHVKTLEQDLSNITDPTVRNKSSLYTNDLKNKIVALQNEQKITAANGVYNNLRIQYSKDPAAYDVTMLDNMFDSLNLSLPSKNQIKKPNFYKGIFDTINAEIVNNSDKYQGKSKEELIKMFPIFNAVKDETLKTSITTTFNAIDAQTTKTNNLKNILGGSVDIAATKITPKEAESAFSLELNSITDNLIAKIEDGSLQNSDKVDYDNGIASLVTRANANGLKITIAENAAGNLYVDKGVNTEASFRNFMKVKGITENGYVLRDSKANAYIEKIQNVGRDEDLNTVEGFANTINKLNQIEALNIPVTKENKSYITETFKDETEKSMFGNAISYVFNSPLLRDNVQMNQSMLPAIMKDAELNIKLGMNQEDAYDAAKQSYIAKFKDTGMVDLRSAGIHTKEDYNKLTNYLSYEQSNNKFDVEKIETFGDSVLVTFDGGSSKELQQQMFSKTDIYKKFQKVNKNKGIKPTFSTDKASKFGGNPSGGKTGVGLNMDSQGVKSNSYFSDTTLEPIAEIANYFLKNAEEGESVEINEKDINAYFGKNSLYTMKGKFSRGDGFLPKFITNPLDSLNTALDIYNEEDKAAMVQSVAGKFTARKDKQGNIILEGSGMVYDFSEDEQGSKGLSFSNGESSSIVLHFQPKHLKNIKPNKPTENMKYGSKIATDYNMNPSTVFKYGLYDIKNEKALNTIGSIYNGFKEQYASSEQPFTEKDIMKKTVGFLQSKYGDVFNYENVEYAFGEKALKFLNEFEGAN